MIGLAARAVLAACLFMAWRDYHHGKAGFEDWLFAAIPWALIVFEAIADDHWARR